MGVGYGVIDAINRTINEDDDESKDADGRPVLTQGVIKNIIKKGGQMYYKTLEINDVLHFHMKGFQEIRNMDLFPNLKVLYFNGNGCRSLNGLQTNTKMKSLYVQYNMIR